MSKQKCDICNQDVYEKNSLLCTCSFICSNCVKFKCPDCHKNTIKWDKENELLCRHTISTHSNIVNSVVAYKTKDNKLRIVSCGDNTIKIWDSVTGVLVKTLTDIVYTLGVYKTIEDDDRIVSGGRNGSIKIWDPITGTVCAETPELAEPANYNVTSLAIGKYGERHIISGNTDGTIKIWKQPHKKKEVTNSSSASTTIDENKKEIDFSGKYKCISTIYAHDTAVTSVAITNTSDDYFDIISGSDDSDLTYSKRAKLYDAKDDVDISDVNINGRKYIDALRCKRWRKKLTRENGSFVSTWKCIEWIGHFESSLYNEPRFAVDTTTHIYPHFKKVNSVSMLENDIISADNDGKISIWVYNKLYYNRYMDTDGFFGYFKSQDLYNESSVKSLICDDSNIFSGHDDGTIKVWRRRKSGYRDSPFECVRIFRGPSSVSSLTIELHDRDQNGSLFSIVAGYSNGLVKIWNRFKRPHKYNYMTNKYEIITESWQKDDIVNKWKQRGLPIPSDFDAKLPSAQFIKRFLIEVSQNEFALGDRIHLYPSDTPKDRINTLTKLLEEVEDNNNFI